MKTSLFLILYLLTTTILHSDTESKREYLQFKVIKQQNYKYQVRFQSDFETKGSFSVKEVGKQNALLVKRITIPKGLSSFSFDIQIPTKNNLASFLYGYKVDGSSTQGSLTQGFPVISAIVHEKSGRIITDREMMEGTRIVTPKDNPNIKLHVKGVKQLSPQTPVITTNLGKPIQSDVRSLHPKPIPPSQEELRKLHDRVKELALKNKPSKRQ